MNLKALVPSKDTVKDGAIAAVGALAYPLASALICKGLDKVKPGIAPKGGLLCKGVDILAAVLVSALGKAVSKSDNVGRMLLVGSISGIVSDFTIETVVPRIPGMSDYLQVGMSDYLKVPGMSDYLNTRQLRLNDYATAGEVANAPAAGTSGEEF